jgi:tRNA U34 2-thiouridine synthase MnmA/TrmU
MSTPRTVTAVGLLSGGLDSTLAARVILDQGIGVVGVNFAGAYCPVLFGPKTNAEKAAEALGIEHVRLAIDAEFVEMVKAPRYGRGKNMNPCIDCHILMIRRAWEYGRSRGADFVFTGEVLGQRPMSQHRQALDLVAKRSGTEGVLLRPLSAKLLPETEPEKQGLVDREKLLNFEGRGRKRQMALARELGIVKYPAPAGGCLLTDAGYSNRLREALEHGEDSVAAIELLALGRHFRLASGSRVVLGRNKAENDELRRRAEGTVVIDATQVPGPLALLIPDSGLGDRRLAARLCARYSDKRQEAQVAVVVNAEAVSVAPLEESEVERLRIG